MQGSYWISIIHCMQPPACGRFLVQDCHRQCFFVWALPVQTKVKAVLGSWWLQSLHPYNGDYNSVCLLVDPSLPVTNVLSFYKPKQSICWENSLLYWVACFAHDLAAELELAGQQNLPGSSGVKRWRWLHSFLEQRMRGAAKCWHWLRECSRGYFVKAHKGKFRRGSCFSSDQLLVSRRPSNLFALSLTTKLACVLKTG